MWPRKEFDKGRFGRVCQFSCKAERGTLPHSRWDIISYLGQNTHPNISLRIQFQGELGHDSLIDIKT